MTSKRIGIVNGTWQIISLAAALRTRDGETLSPACARVGIMAGEASPDFYDLMRRLSERLLGCTPVILDDIISVQAIKEGNSFSPIIGKIAARLSLEGAEELWVGTTEDWQEALVSEALPGVAIYAYEDGMGTYFKGRQAFPEKLKMLATRPAEFLVNFRRLKRYLSPKNPGLVLKLKKLPGKMKDRIKGRFYFLAKFLPLPAHYDRARTISVSSATLRGCVQDAADCYDLSTFDPRWFAGERMTVIVLGQCFSRGSSLGREKELEIYGAVLRELQEKDCRVIWKDHPRLGAGFFEELKRRGTPDGSLEQFPAQVAAPIEVLAAILPREGIVFASAMSTSLFYLSDLYGYPVYNFADRFSHLLDRLHDAIGKSVAGRFPDIREIVFVKDGNPDL